MSRDIELNVRVKNRGIIKGNSYGTMTYIHVDQYAIATIFLKFRYQQFHMVQII